MRRIKILACIIGCLASMGLTAAPGVWTPAADSLPDSVQRFTETPIGRFETIAVGSFPILLFYVGFGFDFADYAQSGFNRTYAPWPFKSANAPALGQAELGQRLGTTVMLSLGVAALDAILRPIDLARKKRENPESHFPSPPQAAAPNQASPDSSASTPEANSGTAQSAEGATGQNPPPSKP